tara:strand:+ start:5012 stop:5344 length:333 start_codon:yes stop_codon:yes gene_type:complete
MKITKKRLQEIVLEEMRTLKEYSIGEPKEEEEEGPKKPFRKSDLQKSVQTGATRGERGRSIASMSGAEAEAVDATSDIEAAFAEPGTHPATAQVLRLLKRIQLLMQKGAK